MVIDASVVLRGFFPDEVGQADAQALMGAYAQREVELLAPTLLPYEVTNAILQAVRRERIDLETGRQILAAFQALGIPTVQVPWQQDLELAHAWDRPAYDGAYLALALALDAGHQLDTGDHRLYNAVREHSPWVLFIGGHAP
jgi:predicted nucleic acid-binding protein